MIWLARCEVRCTRNSGDLFWESTLERVLEDPDIEASEVPRESTYLELMDRKNICRKDWDQSDRRNIDMG